MLALIVFKSIYNSWGNGFFLFLDFNKRMDLRIGIWSLFPLFFRKNLFYVDTFIFFDNIFGKDFGS